MGNNMLNAFYLISPNKWIFQHTAPTGIWSTTTTILGRLRYSKMQIISVSGHKSSASLEIYQKVNDKEKMKMGTDFGNVILKREITEAGPNAEPQFVVRNNEIYEIPEDPEEPIPKCPLHDIQKTMPITKPHPLINQKFLISILLVLIFGFTVRWWWQAADVGTEDHKITKCCVPEKSICGTKGQPNCAYIRKLYNPWKH